MHKGLLYVEGLLRMGFSPTRYAAGTAASLTLLLVSLVGGPVFAQSPGVSPTPEQLEMLQSLPPEERQALMEQASNQGRTGTAPLVTIGANPGAESGQPTSGRGPAAAAPKAGRLQPDDRGLLPYGYDIFRQVGGTFEPEAAIPVPNDYVIGPGDKIEVQLYGNERQNVILVVGRDGQVRLPKIGPIQVGGMSFDAVKTMVERRVEREFVGTEISISMGELRSIRVFVLGDVEQPGSYLVSALTTISNTLIAAGGVTENGSLRDVQLKRSGAVVARLDAYDLLLDGDSSRDVRLLSGDVVFVPPVGLTAAISGEVRRPAIYEVKSGSTVADLLHLSGGLKPVADPRSARITRISERQQRVTVDVNLSVPDGRGIRLRAGDEVMVLPVRPSLMGSVDVTGAVFRPRSYEHREGLRISEVIPSIDELKPEADSAYVLVRREAAGGGLEFFSTDLRRALAVPGSQQDVLLRPRDRIVVLEKNASRTRELTPLIEELRSQARLDMQSQLVQVGGSVPFPGSYPLEAGMRVSDLLRAGGTLGEDAFGATAELVRYDASNGERRQTALVSIDLVAVRRGDEAANLALQSYDVLTVKQLQDWGETEYMSVRGSVRFPGRYPVRRGDTLASVINRAGGVTGEAYLQGAVFTRASVREQEQQQVERLALRMQSDLNVLAVRGSQTATSRSGDDAQSQLTAGRALLADLRSTRAVGRIVVDIEAVMRDPKRDLEVYGDDELLVPRTPKAVAVIGEVQSPISHLWQQGIGRDSYIEKSGGVTGKADKRRIYVVHVDGSVDSQGRGWLLKPPVAKVRPGDTVVVPVDAERMKPLPLWSAVTQIIYNLAIAAAAVNSF